MDPNHGSHQKAHIILFVDLFMSHRLSESRRRDPEKEKLRVVSDVSKLPDTIITIVLGLRGPWNKYATGFEAISSRCDWLDLITSGYHMVVAQALCR